MEGRGLRAAFEPERVPFEAAGVVIAVAVELLPSQPGFDPVQMIGLARVRDEGLGGSIGSAGQRLLDDSLGEGILCITAADAERFGQRRRNIGVRKGLSWSRPTGRHGPRADVGSPRSSFSVKRTGTQGYSASWPRGSGRRTTGLPSSAP